jgi:RimJ/RimL family protein N-acetyltransferase
MVRAFVEQLFQDPEVTRIQTDPSPDNESAIRSYRRAGFVSAGEIVTPDGPAVLMLRERSSHTSTRSCPIPQEVAPASTR